MTASTSTSAPNSGSAAVPTGIWEPPGGILVWLLVLVELLTFGMGLAVLVVLGGREPEVFAVGRAGLHRGWAFINTLVLVTGGWWMAEAITSLRNGRGEAARRGILGAAGFGALFLAVKGAEYASKLSAGQDLHRDTFHTLYWLLTGFHYLHVAVAVVLLLAVRRGWRGCDPGREAVENAEAAGVFWHLCDAIWLILVPFLYLLP